MFSRQQISGGQGGRESFKAFHGFYSGTWPPINVAMAGLLRVCAWSLAELAISFLTFKKEQSRIV
jgi:hypothetical protein